MFIDKHKDTNKINTKDRSIKMADVMLVGEPMVLFYADEYGSLAEVNHFKKGLAGAEVNVGIGLSRLGHEVSYLTKISTDEMGDYIYHALEKEKLASDYVFRDPTLPVGVMYKNKVKEGDPKTLYYRKGSAASTISKSDIDRIDFTAFKVVHLTGIPAALSPVFREASFYLIEKARESGCIISFDSNLRPSLWESEAVMIETINALAKQSDIFLPGIEEGQLLTGLTDIEAIADYYLEQGVQHVVIKNGSKGAFVKSHNQEKQDVPGFVVEHVVDTVGAGDGFAVGVIDGVLRQLSMVASVENANAIGAIQVQSASDNEALPTIEELNTFKKEAQRG